MNPQGDTYSITLAAYNHETGGLLQEGSIHNVPAGRLTGNVALISQGGPAESTFWFDDWRVSGSKVEVTEEQRFGPVLSAIHTLSKQVLKMTVQLPPMATTDPQSIRLELAERGGNTWRAVGEEELIVPGWTATFRITDWNSRQDFTYRLVYPLRQANGQLQEHYFTGTIRRDPVDKQEIVVAAFTGNSNTHGTFDARYAFTENTLWFPHKDISTNAGKHNPDLLVFTGDQVYEGRPTQPDRSGEPSSYLDYLYKWALWSWAYADLARNIPTVCLPDDHDVYHGNVWGAGGQKTRGAPKDGQYPSHYQGFEGHWEQDGGGYRMPADFVNMVQRTQTSHLPDPYDPTPVEQDITVYYTDMNYGGISFAIIEDRKFKSSPSVMVTEGKVVNGFPQVPNFDGRHADVQGAKLLGERQLKFLRDWAADWTDSWMKVSLSQTVFANLTTYPEDFKTDAGAPRLEPVPFGEIPSGYRLAKDMDSNGWPQTGRNKALDELRRAFAFMISGDQHLASILHHGIEEWEDAGFSLCVPSIGNLFPRRWYPPSRGENHQSGMPDYTGRYRDGFGNRVTVWAVANPVTSNQQPAALHDRAPGYGIVRLRKKEQTITIECWPRYQDPTAAGAAQYPGWPLTISMEDNYGRPARAYLPTLQFTGLSGPVVQVIDESNDEILYTTRAKGDTYRAKVFRPGTYTVKVGKPGTDRMQTLQGIRSVDENDGSTVIVEF